MENYAALPPITVIPSEEGIQIEYEWMLNQVEYGRTELSSYSRK